jgi:hypothetical protein
MNSHYTRKNIVRQQKLNRYTQRLTGRKPDDRMFFHRLRQTLSKSMKPVQQYEFASAANPPPVMSAVPEDESVRYAPYNRKAQFILSRKLKHLKSQLSARNLRRQANLMTKRNKSRATAAAAAASAGIKKTRKGKATKKTTLTNAARTAKAPRAPRAAKAVAVVPSRRSTRLVAKETGEQPQFMSLQNAPKPRRTGVKKAEMNNLSAMFGSRMGMNND